MEYLAAVYARVSTDDQKDAGTIANQIGEARRYARQTQGVLLGEMYLDDGVTSSVPFEERPSGKRLMEDARAAKFNLVLAFRLDRVERTARRLLQLEYELSQLGVTLVLISENIPPSGPQRQMALTMLAAFAEYEKSTIDERTTLGRHRILREG